MKWTPALRKSKFPAKLCVLLALALSSGCAHKIAFQDVSYNVVSDKSNDGLVAVIDQKTLEQSVAIHSWTTGIAHSWDAYPGQMLKQVADVEFPQLFRKYKYSESFDMPSWENEFFFAKLTVQNYQFRDFHAYFSVRMIVYNKEKDVLLEKTYTAEGKSQGKKMFWGGAFAMKSAMRQSSLGALKKIFRNIRGDFARLTHSDNQYRATTTQPLDIGESSHLVESLAKQSGCVLDGIGTLLSSEYGTEIYRINCKNIDSIIYRCQYRQCERMQ